MYNNLEDIINNKHNYLQFIILIMLFVSLTIIMLSTKTYSIYETSGVYIDRKVYVNIDPLKYSEIKKTKPLINDVDVKTTLISISELQLDNFMNYQVVTYKIKNEYKDNEIIKVKYLYNYESIIRKILKKIY